MTGGLINIISYGLNDLYLTGAPQITFFKVVYRRHTNFSKESIAIALGEIKFQEEINIPFPKVGDLFNNTYLQLEIPSIHLLKTDTALDLTDDERTLLTTPLPLPLTVDQIAIINDYQTIIKFLAVNMQGYRTAVQNQSIKNQTVQDYVTAILASLNFPGSLDTDYQTALERARTYENSIGNRNYDIILDYIFSDIKNILLTQIVNPNTYSNYTIADVAYLVQSATNISVQVKNYYFKKTKEQHDLQIDYSSLYAKFAWVERLGHAIIDKIDINIGGDRIDRHYGEWLNIWYDLTSYDAQDKLYNKLIGNVVEMTTFDRNEKPSYLLTIPLSFWFCRNAGLSFPIIALQYSPVSLSITLSKLENCAILEKLPTKDANGDPVSITELSLSDIWDNLNFKINGTLLVDYVYLDNQERKRFAQSAHEYLIETNQRTSLDGVLLEESQTLQIDFVGPCKELIWFAQKTRLIEGKSTDKKYRFLYSLNIDGTGNPIINSQLTLNGYVRFGKLESGYYNYLQPNSHHTRTPPNGINVYSFSLFPEEHQPSSNCNFSRIVNPVFDFVIDTRMFSYNLSDIDPTVISGSTEDLTNDTDINIVVYTIRYNILRFIGGMAGFAFKYMV